MKRITLSLLIVFLLIGFNAFAGDGDLIVNGKVGVGTTDPTFGIGATGNIIGIKNPSNNSQIILGQSTTAHANLVWGYSPTEANAVLDLGTRTNNSLNLKTNNEYRLTINGQGNVGIGTTNPSQKLDVDKAILIRDSDLNNTYTNGLLLGTSLSASSDGYSAQWLRIGATGTSRAAGAKFDINSWYNGDVDRYLPLTFSIQGTEVMRISSATYGYVGIFTTTPQYQLDVNGYVRAFNVSVSDIRFKKDITPLENPLQSVLNLQGVNYYWRVDEFKDRNFEEGWQIGLIAQEVEQVLPELVKTDSEGYKAVSYEKLTAVLVEAIKEQQKKIGELEARIKLLEKGR